MCMLKKFILHPIQTITGDDVQPEPNLSYREVSAAILGQDMRRHRSKLTPMIRV